MVKGIQIDKISIERQVDSLFEDEDLVRLGDGELQGLIMQYFGRDFSKAYDYAIKRRSKLLKPEDRRSYERLYHQKRKLSEYRIPLRLKLERDADIIEWLNKYDNKSEIIRRVLREHVDNNKGANQ